MEILFSQQQAVVMVVASQYDRANLLEVLERAGFKAKIVAEG